MTKNDKNFVKAFASCGEDVEKVQKYVKENFNIDSTYNEEEMTIKLECHNIDESLQLVAAKEYIENNTNSEFVSVVF